MWASPRAPSYSDAGASAAARHARLAASSAAALRPPRSFDAQLLLLAPSREEEAAAAGAAAADAALSQPAPAQRSGSSNGGGGGDGAQAAPAQQFMWPFPQFPSLSPMPALPWRQPTGAHPPSSSSSFSSAASSARPLPPPPPPPAAAPPREWDPSANAPTDHGLARIRAILSSVLTTHEDVQLRSAAKSAEVVIVRDSAARRKLLADMPELLLVKAQVLTVAESKGLEWNGGHTTHTLVLRARSHHPSSSDVFLVNLLSDCRCHPSEWGCVAQAALQRWDGCGGDALPPAEALAAATFRPHLRPCGFDARKHFGVPHELRSAYVAISRGRRRVLVFESDVALRAPLFAYLTRPVASRDGGPPQPPVAVLGDRPAARAAELLLTGGSGGGSGGALGPLARGTSADAWRDRAAALLARGQLAHAADAFRHAGCVPEEAGARAQLCEGEAASAADAPAQRLAWLSAASWHCRAGAHAAAAGAARAAARAAAAAPAAPPGAGAQEAALAGRLEACAARAARV